MREQEQEREREIEKEPEQERERERERTWACTVMYIKLTVLLLRELAPNSHALPCRL